MRILLADDHAMVRENLKAILQAAGYDVVGEAANGYEAVALAARLKPDVAILEFSIPLLNGIEVAREISRLALPTSTILLTTHDHPAYISNALRAGVRGYVLNTEGTSSIAATIAEVAKGSIRLPSGFPARVFETGNKSSENVVELLTSRESQILQLIAEGNSSKEIGQILRLSLKTVDTHRTNLMRKLGIHNTAGLVRYAVRCNLIVA
jgi:DNA-binding NarL/FixJ family response regulator